MSSPSNLPKPVGFSDDLIHRIAMDIGKEVVAHIEQAYPEMFRAVMSHKSAALSIRNATLNSIMEHMRSADEGRSEVSIERHEKHRRKVRKIRSATNLDELRRAARS